MRTFFIIALLLWVLAGSYFISKKFCGGKDIKKPAATSTAAAAATKGDCDRSLVFADGDFKVTSSENFMFAQHSPEIKQQLNSSTENLLVKVADFLNENPDKSLQVEAYYHLEEKKPDDFENLGLARADAIKNYLISEFGINESQVVLGAQSTKFTTCNFNPKTKSLIKGATTTLGLTE